MSTADVADAAVIPPGQLGHGLMAVLRRHRPDNGRAARDDDRHLGLAT